jgi:hypothetical protein
MTISHSNEDHATKNLNCRYSPFPTVNLVQLLLDLFTSKNFLRILHLLS